MSNKSKDVQDLMGITMEKIKEMVDVSTIVGEPINSPDGTIIIPISKVSFGFGAGGSDFEKTSNVFGGAGGAGVTIQPLAFLVISNGDVKMLQMENSDSAAEKAVGLIPEIINTIADLFKKKPDEDVNTNDSKTENDNDTDKTNEVKTEDL